jgi:hypothetical protein
MMEEAHSCWQIFPLKTDSLRFRFGQAVLVCLLVMGATACQVRQPGAVETAFMQGIKRKVTVGGKKDANPFTAK